MEGKERKKQKNKGGRMKEGNEGKKCGLILIFMR